MSKRMTLGMLALALAGGLVSANAAEKVVVVSVEKVDTATKTLACKTADGTAETFKYTEKTMVKGTKDVAKASDLAGKDSYHFAVHYTEEGSEKVATGMDFTGKGAWKATKGTVTAVDHAGKTVTVKLADGTVETYHLADHCTVDAGKGVGKMSEDAGKGVVKGSEVTVHYTEEGGKKIAHFLHM
jgi:hypothetical protein